MLTPLQGKTKTSASYKMGSAVYPSVSLMNHSCDENTFTSYIGKTAVVRAVKKIKKGEEIFNCYGKKFCILQGHRIGDGTSTDQRRKLLMQQYYFHCKCSACTSETVVKKERISMAFKCVRCSGPFCKLDEKVDAVATNFVCLDCGSTSDVSPDQIQSCIRRFWIINDSGKADQIFEAVKSLENLYHKFFLCLVSIRREACSALLKHGKINDCVDLMIRNLDCIAFHDGGQNLTFANEVLEELVYSVYFDKNLKRKDEVLKHIDKSIEIFTVYFGPNCHHVQILNDAKHFVG
uniref:SET domain-containing protein n=1 Tax=Romanomermis culicivorax TaxID=13658 RepID=A0A915KNF8_ROMCU